MAIVPRSTPVALFPRLVFLAALASGTALAAQQPPGARPSAAHGAEPATRAPVAGQPAPDVQAPPVHAASPGEGAAASPAHAENGAQGAEHGESIWATLSRVLNFAILAGTVFYFVRSPFARHLVARSEQIRGDLAHAAEARATAEAEMSEIDRRLQALPAEVDAIRRRGQADIAADRARIREATEVERAALVEHVRREIDLKVRIAEQALVGRTADLAVGLARARILATIGREDQDRLLDRYLNQLRAADRA